MTLPFRLRDPANSDLGFILSTWLNGAREAWDAAKTSDVSAWAPSGIRIGHFADLTRKFTRESVAGILQRETCRVVVACDVEDDDVIYGYAVAEPSKRVIHWTAVKYQFKGHGIAREMVLSLLPDAARGVTCSYLPSGFVALQSKWPVRFDPHAGK
jgi:predicted GNAT family acetyltransferase